MCGVIGVSKIPEAGRLAYLGLYALQHRGQESAGIVAVDREGQARVHRGMGLVSETFPEPVMKHLTGDVAVGHTRYSTAGSTVLANAQPCFANTRCGALSVAHNGNLTNAPELRRELVEQAHVAGFNYLVLQLAFGSLGHANEMRSLELFAREIKPALEILA